MRPTKKYLHSCGDLIQTISDQESQIDQTAGWFSESILGGGLVHLFGSGHSRIMVEEMWPRYGSFPGFHPIVELSLTFHNQVVGANGQRQAMFLENVTGLAEKIIRNFKIGGGDCAMIISSSGCNLVQIEMAELFQQKGVKVVALISKEHSDGSKSNRDDGLKLADFADLVLDTGAPLGDAMVHIEGMETPVSPGSTVGGVMVMNCIKAVVAQRLVQAGFVPHVLTASAIVGPSRSEELFENAYDEHGKRISRIYDHSVQST